MGHSPQTWVCKRCWVCQQLVQVFPCYVMEKLCWPTPHHFTFYTPGQFQFWGLVLAWWRHSAAVELLSCPIFASSGRRGLCLYSPWWGGGLTSPRMAAPACLCELERLRPSVFWACPTAISHSSACWTTLWVLLQGGDFPTTKFCFLTMPVISVLNSMVSFSSLFSYAVEELSSDSQA